MKIKIGRFLGIFGLCVSILMSICLQGFVGTNAIYAQNEFTDSGFTASNDTELRTALTNMSDGQFIKITADFDLNSYITTLTMDSSVKNVQLRADSVREIGVVGNSWHFLIVGEHKFSFENVRLKGPATLDPETGLVSGGNTGGGIRILSTSETVILDNLWISNVNGMAVSTSTNSKIELNNAKIFSNQGVIGGGVKLEGGTQAVINNSEISKNTASSSGGGIAIASGVDLEINNSHIDNNLADYGGGISTPTSITSPIEISISNSTINENQSTSSIRGGGGIFIYNNTKMDIQSSQINRNIARTGGGIYVRNTNLNISNSSVNQNKTVDRGGAIVILGNILTTSIVNGSKLSGNTSEGNGGAIATENTNQHLEINNSEIIDNSSSLQSGGIHFPVNPENAKIGRDVIFANNSDANSTQDADFNWPIKKIYYNSNDGTNRQFRTFFLNDVSGDFGIVSDKQFSRDGHNFLEWNIQSGANGVKYSSSDRVYEDIHIFAIWQTDEQELEAPNTGFERK